MKEASRLMYKIGRIFNFVLFGLYGLWFVLGLVDIIVGAANDDAVRVGNGISGIIFSTIYIAATLVALILAKKAMDALSDDKQNKKEHITMIVVGAISNDIFYLLGGIFGLVAESQDANAESAPKEEAKAEEPAEEAPAEEVVVEEAPAQEEKSEE